MSRLSEQAASTSAAEAALQKTAAHLEKMKNKKVTVSVDDPPDPLGVERENKFREYLQQSANVLKLELKERKLVRTGNKPDLARRLVQDDLETKYGDSSAGKEQVDGEKLLVSADDIHMDMENGVVPASPGSDGDADRILGRFAGLDLSAAAGGALGKANFVRPSPIQAAAIPALAKGESLILHAETGSGKTLAYLLPITEQLWMDQNQGFAVILTPTRELAAQVAGIASVLAPPGTVRLVSRPTNLMSDGLKDRGELENGGRFDDLPTGVTPKLFVGSAKSIMHSLYGDGRMPASPTSKPEAMAFLKNVRWLVMDEVDRLLGVKKSRGEKQNKAKQHDKPAAVVAAAVVRLSLGRAKVVSASATVGRPLKRELARVLGLPPQDCPRVIRGDGSSDDDTNEESAALEDNGVHLGRAVKIPDTVENYVVESMGASDGKLLTTAYHVVNALGTKPRKMLMVLTRGFGINTQNAIGALSHFQCDPEPRSLLDALETDGDGTDRMIQLHREVSGASGIGESSYFQEKSDSAEDGKGYLLVTGEDTVRGLHLDGLDVVIVVGRPNGPDEYTHIAGRTGRAGRSGKVINIVGPDNASSIKSWEKMLGVDFSKIEVSDVKQMN
jgi:exosome complex RNA-binding protein Csl4